MSNSKKKTDHRVLMEFREKQAVEKIKRNQENSTRAPVEEGSNKSFNFQTGQFE